MLWVILLSSSFLVVILIGVLVLAFNVRNYVHHREEENKKRFDELKERIDETQDLFRKEVTQILNTFKAIINK